MVNPPQHPLVSVIMPVHNGAEWLAETLQALYVQTYQTFEIILIDDASTDNIDQVLSRQVDERLRVLRLPNNVGVSAARNRGIKEALGPYVAFCDADDLCLPQRLQKQVEFLETHPEVGFCGSALTCFDTEDRETVQHPLEHEQIRRRLMEGNCFGLSTVMIRTSLLMNCQFDPNLKAAEDYDLWTRLVGSGVFAANLAQVLVKYRIHSQQASQHKSVELDHTTRRLRASYCAALLGDVSYWDAYIKQKNLSLDQLWQAAIRVNIYTKAHPGLASYDFRFMFAWFYQKISSHGIVSWWYWRKVQLFLNLKLDWNYKLNIALLAFLPSKLKIKYFDALIKLKR
jgi:glycosyltransferase involved in cell wall biosynthesis